MKKITIILTFLIISLLLFALTVVIVLYINEGNRNQQRIEQLEKQLDECIFGEERTIAIVEKAYAEKNFTLARENIEKLSNNHPQSPKNKEFKVLLTRIEQVEKVEDARRKAAELSENKRKAAAEKERLRLANLNKTGIWSVHYYVDDFGEPTKKAYIRNTSKIRGQFSNTATQDSELDVIFLISNSSNISIQLYEYAGNNPVKSYSSKSYTVLVQDTDGVRLRLKAVNNSERLRFNTTDSRKLHNALMKGGTFIKFRITEDDTPTTQYEFSAIQQEFSDNDKSMLISH